MVAAAEEGKQRAGRGERPADVRREDLVGELVVEPVEVVVRDESRRACAVDEDVTSVERRSCGVERCALRDGKPERAVSLTGQSRRAGARSLIRCAVPDGYGVRGIGERAADRRPEPARAAGDDRDECRAQPALP